jgi:serine/threonine-protein kinase
MEELIGKKIENYQILSILGKGGMGIVYKARDEKLDRFVAIKFLAFEMVNNPKLAERFKREAKNHAQLLHSNIVTVYGFIEYKNLLGIVMEFVEGESIEKVLFRNTRLHIYDVVYIMRQVLLGIGYAHSKGFIHRDIKPSNIIVNSEGTVKIMDFGISKSIFEQDMTLTGSKIGTVFYMSPEQIKGNNINYLSDIYSVGCTMFEMLTGQPPFYSDTEYDVMDGHLKKEPPKISDFVPGIPVEMEKIVAKCLQKQADMRYKSCGEIIDEFHSLDEYLKSVNSKYFLRKKKNPKLTKIKSIIFLALLMISFLGLFYFAYVQVDEFIKARLYEKMDKIDFGSLTTKKDKVDFLKFATVKTNLKENIRCAYFFDAKRGIVAGDSSFLAVTSDSCKSWQRIKTFSESSIYDIAYFQNGFFLAGNNNLLMKFSTDFQSSIFVRIKDGLSFFRLKVINQKLYCLASEGNIFTSSDGLNWKNIKLQIKSGLFDINFFNDKIGITVGWNGEVYRTKNSGKTWVKLESFTQKYLKSISVNEDGIGFIVGAGGSIFRTQDFGETWIEIKTDSKEGLQSVEILSENKVMAVGNKGIMLVSKDLGFTWEIINSGLVFNLNRIMLNNYKTNGYVLGNNGTIIQFNLRK